MTTLLRCGVFLVAGLVACGSDGATGASNDPSGTPNGSSLPGTGNTTADGGPGAPGTSTTPGTPWVPPTTNGPPATCAPVSGSFGGLSMIACVPAGGAGKTGKPAPLVVALHGYTQTAEAYKDTTQWEVLAGRYGFYVIYPGAPGARSWTWFGADRARGQGDGGGIVAMVDKMKADHDIRADLVFVTGLSAGGYETTVMLADYPDVFAAGAAVAGGPYGCTTACMSAGKGDAQTVKSAFPSWWNDASTRKPRLLVVQGDKDNIVSPTNLGETVKQWISATGTDPAPANAKLGIAQDIKGYPYAVYSKDGTTPSVASLTVTGMAHGTPVNPGTAVDEGGQTGSYAMSTKVYSPYYIAKFFGLIP